MTSITKKRYVDNLNFYKSSGPALAKLETTGLALIISLSLVGCEAPLNLEGVEAEKQKQVRRTDQLQGIAANATTLVVVGSDGLVLTSPLDQLSWTRHQLDDAPALVDVAVCPDQSFVALSIDKRAWFSADNGLSWQSKKLPTPEDLLDLTCAPDNSIWVVGSFSTVLNSTDKGESWHETTLNEDAMLTGIQFVDQNTVFISGEFGLVSRSDDAGMSWNTPEMIPNDFYTHAAHFTSASEGWVGGLSGQILYTEDAGVSWEKQLTPTESPIYGFYSIGEKLFAFGDHSTLLSFTGQDWAEIDTHGRPVYLRDVTQLPSGDFLLAGGSGSLFSLAIQPISGK
ncbi:YCF48-related protein [Neptuniibacter sp. 2_MG-2023]|uniref:WD40/YVTN/BNR-like repeat-containing protein n=1 Tax=Neptuniibacter sp. 2_MG-2023 TaxID=3062671 RepID=UPI0026E3B65C|nr:YCF48-related protein [Neptuniibacter sp. 2_MG-2023]MDO6513295.1 YCF48-related protein [Neptuniibacter sp. 2_MG-2023]